jgi:RHS repeat-associated protein
MGTDQGWIGSPLYGATVSGIVPITVAPGVTLQSGTLSYFPTTNTFASTTLNANVSGSGQIGALDTTMLANGSYWIQMQATDINGNSQYSLLLVTVTGNYKPGRITSTVTDLVVPATGLAIQIQRTYDSLNAATSGDFGYGWNLGINVNLTVSPHGDVTFTLGGQRRTFFLTPEMPGGGGCTIVGCLFPYYFAAYTPQPGFYGSLSASDLSCPLGIVVPDGNLWLCQGGGSYSPASYVYTDANGTSYNISASGQLQSIVDRTGNGLSITSNGITSTTGLNVPFVRDTQNRITQITDPLGNVYEYAYDESGNLASVTYPSTPQPSTYTYDANHYYLSGTDFRNNPLPTNTYYTASDADPNGLPLNGRLHTVTDGLGETTAYAYDLVANSTTITYPPDGSGNVGTATMVYDTNGNLLSSTDPLGHTTTNVYDSNQNLLSMTDPLGHTTTYTYDQNGNRTSQTYPATATSTNTTSTTAYNQYSEPTSIADELGNVRTFSYDANYNPRIVNDSAGVAASYLFNNNGSLQAGAAGYDITAQPAMATQFTYDANGNISSSTDALGRTTSFTYDSLGNKLSMTVPAPSTSGSSQGARASRRYAARANLSSESGGGVSSEATVTIYFQYSAISNVTVTSGPLGRVSTWQYDANGNASSYTDPLGNTTYYQYDALNRLIAIVYPTNPATTVTLTYDFRNNIVTETRPGGHVTYYSYDAAGRRVAVTRDYGTANASTITFTYDAAGHKTSETDALGRTTTYTYDADGRLIAVSGVKGNFSYAYDDAGNRIAITDANGNTTQYQYDARKRRVKTIFPDGTSKSYSYTGPGKLASVTDQAGNTVQYNYDPDNELTSVVQLNHPNSSNNTNVYGYDVLGDLTTVADENGDTTQNSFDMYEEPISKTLPDGSLTESRQYDADGDLISKTHFNGKTTTYTYDGVNRLLARTPDPSLGETPVTFTYGPNGRFSSSTDASGTTTYTYGALGRLMSKATPEGTLNYAYDGAGRVTSIASSNPNGASVSYAYDDLNRLNTVVDNRLGTTTTYTYDAASNVSTATYPNGLQSTFTYDQEARLTALSAPTASYSYQLGPTGLRTQATESTGRTLNWTYDGIYRLTNEKVGTDPDSINGSVLYGLDPVGNRQSETSTLPGINSGSFGYNVDDELATETFDANGNTVATGGKAFAYDSENRLASMNGGSVSIIYDAFGNRVGKTANGVTTKYLVEDDVNPTGLPQVFDELTNGVVTRTYTYGFQRISENQLIDNAWTPSFYAYDGAGSVRQLTNSAGAVTDTYEYDAFGNETNHTGATPNNYLYRGEQWDPDLGLYYLRARYMNPLTGRFLSRDPKPGHIEIPRSLHKYLYASDDPVNRIDPRGKEDLVEEDGADSEPEAAEPGERALASRINCILDTTAGALNALSALESGDYLGGGLGAVSLAVNWETCSGEATGEGEEEPPTQCPLCFAAGTPIHTNHGDVPIEKVEVGDEVVSRNSATGKEETEPVTALTPQHRDSLLEIRVEGERSPLRPSTHHPFWVKRGDAAPRWVASGEMRVGDFVESLQGNWRRVVSITPLPGQETVYNFTVDQNHDYFVGETGFLVHNANSCNCQPNSYAELYELYDGFGNFLKWGISFNPATRYTGPQLEGMGGSPGPVRVDSGTRRQMLNQERELRRRFPGPLNCERDAGANSMW